LIKNIRNNSSLEKIIYVEIYNIVLFISYCSGDHIKEDGKVGDVPPLGIVKKGLKNLF
jgi:hypothetical protein